MTDSSSSLVGGEVFAGDPEPAIEPVGGELRAMDEPTHLDHRQAETTRHLLDRILLPDERRSPAIH